MCTARATARERASPRASAAVVEVVGAQRSKEADSGSGIGAGRRISVGRTAANLSVAYEVCAVRAMTGRSEGMCGRRASSSGVFPEKVIRIMISF